MEKKPINPNFPHILHGGDYNPDQWQDRPDILREDMRLMKLANCNEMSVAIFAWQALEPEDGVFDFSFLDRAMDDIYAAGGRVILATPSAAKPAWLSKKYPEVLPVNEDGVRLSHGNRMKICFTSPVFRQKVAEVDRAIGERYAHHPALYAWHLGNEYSGQCYCPVCRRAFRDYLKEKYGTLDNLNRSIWSAFWSHTFTDWDQIDPPTPNGEGSLHALSLDWRHFCTRQTADFMRMEADSVREFNPDIPVTTNFMGFYMPLDYRELAKSLDFISDDVYPTWRADEEEDIKTAQCVSLRHDLMRSMKHAPWLLMESTPSLVNWHKFNKLKRPGVNELFGLGAVAHGADSVQYFQWRKSRGGAEKFHGAVVDHEGSENTRVFREVSHLGARLKKLDAVVGTLTRPKVAILYDWNSNWAIDFSQGFRNGDNKGVVQAAESYYAPLWNRGIDVEVISVEDDFSPYALIIAPMLYAVSAETGAKLDKYVADGGTLVGTYTLAMTDENDLCYLGGFPGAGLRKVFGIWNEEIDTLYPGESNLVVSGSGEYTAVDHCEIIHAEGAEVIAEYAGDFYAGGPAATRHSYGKGTAYYVAFRDTGEYAERLLGDILDELEIKSEFAGTLGHGVTAHSRTDGENVYVFLQNFSQSDSAASTTALWSDLETGERVTGDIALKALETRILTRPVK